MPQNIPAQVAAHQLQKTSHSNKVYRPIQVQGQSVLTEKHRLLFFFFFAQSTVQFLESDWSEGSISSSLCQGKSHIYTTAPYDVIIGDGPSVSADSLRIADLRLMYFPHEYVFNCSQKSILLIP